jgi:hypothetical protein
MTARQPAPGIEDGYQLCPDCGGTKCIARIIRPGDGWVPAVTSIEPCRRCGFTGIVPVDDEVRP